MDTQRTFSSFALMNITFINQFQYAVDRQHFVTQENNVILGKKKRNIALNKTRMRTKRELKRAKKREQLEVKRQEREATEKRRKSAETSLPVAQFDFS